MSTTSNPNDPRLGHGADNAPVPMNEVYLVLSDEQRAKGFIRPVLRTYVHELSLGGCGGVTTMGQAIAETYAARPRYYGATYCCGCRMHRPVGEHGEFYWIGTNHVTWTPGGEMEPSTEVITANKLKVGT